MYRKLPWTGGDPRSVAEIVNNLVEGKSNNTGEVTLATGNATTTTINDERIGYNSIILLTPISVAAGSDTVPYGAFQDSTDQTAASTTAAALMRLRLGVAPTAPNDGDIWLESNTTTGLKIRIAGVTRTITIT
jgi:hypothetical protein